MIRSYSQFESSIISIDSNITDNIISKVIGVHRKPLEPRMEPWGTSALSGYSWEDFPFRTRPEPEAAYYWDKTKWGRITDQKFHNTQVCEEDKHTKPYQSFKYIQCYSSSSPSTIKSPSNSIRHKCQKTCRFSHQFCDLRNCC